ncbi:hypothetical protein KIF24_09540 [Micromonospora sp. Llam7]|uniref:hypothetical protein n=1 Tax=Micromonospora tarapacensis TaxID=2835305 RepID=UPI001C83F97E|nr:hypothetical protein [Micromonospora tarapacensis]MBX7266238.1 hypothetical protein [Micromonospora tarapacensis]
MTGGPWLPLGAIGVAALVSILALPGARKKRPSWRAGHWIALRVGMDAASAYVVFRLGAEWVPGADPLPLMLVAGLSGPAILRTQVSFLTNSHQLKHYGPATMYGWMQRNLDNRIDEISSAEQSRWVSRALPVIERLGIDTIRTQVESYLRGLDKLSREQLNRELLYLRQVAEDPTDHSTKCRSIVQRLLDRGDHTMLRSLEKEGGRLAAVPASKPVQAP